MPEARGAHNGGDPHGDGPVNERPIRPTGRVYEGRRGEDGRMIYRDINAEAPRLADWRGTQSKTPIKDILAGKK